MKYGTDDIIYALATGFSKGAIALIRVSGEGCIEKTAPHFTGKLLTAKSNCAVYGHLSDADDVVITVYKDGHGYTGEESLEISCHGGSQSVRAVLTFLSSLGFRQALGGEFSLRAFMHGKMDLTRAEAVNELINSRGNNARNAALKRLNGSLFKKISEIKQAVLKIMGLIEVQLDYAEDEISEEIEFPFDEIEIITQSLSAISNSYKTGKLYSEGAKIVLCGSVNAGKSSLFNWFLKEERAIVSPVEGTTRDFIEAQCSVDGIPVRLYDTAGLRVSSDSIEEEGMKRSRLLVDNADIILYLVPADKPESDEKLINNSKTICILSKSDLSDVKKDGFINISVEKAEGFEALLNAISKKLHSGIEDSGEDEIVIESERQKNLIDSAIISLENASEHFRTSIPLEIVAMDIQESLDSLGEITGEVTSDDILDRIFSDFCVGK